MCLTARHSTTPRCSAQRKIHSQTEPDKLDVYLNAHKLVGYVELAQVFQLSQDLLVLQVGGPIIAKLGQGWSDVFFQHLEVKVESSHY